MTVLDDLAIGARALLRSPRFSAVSILVLLLGVGANAMLFSVADAVLFRQFGGDRGVIGGALVLSDTPFTVVGVMPPAFRYPVGVFFMVGRLKPGAIIDAARLELSRVIAQRERLAGRHRDVETRPSAG